MTEPDGAQKYYRFCPKMDKEAPAHGKIDRKR